MNGPYHHALTARLPQYFDDPIAISRERAAWRLALSAPAGRNCGHWG
jgi:hypothetical protein